MARMMTIVLFLLLPLSAGASCYADYKAKKDNPLRLHYGVIELPDAVCGNRQAARREIAERIGGSGWQLLSIEAIFDESGLDQRRGNAGRFFLRF